MDQFINIIGISDKEPWYKKRSKCEKKEIKITVSSEEDAGIARIKGVAGLRQHKLKRICSECENQESLLSLEELGNLLTSSVKTISRDIRNIQEKEGIMLRTRGKNAKEEGSTRSKGDPG